MEFPEPIKYRMSKNSFDIEPQGSLFLFQLSIADVGFSTDADGGKYVFDKFFLIGWTNGSGVGQAGRMEDEWETECDTWFDAHKLDGIWVGKLAFRMRGNVVKIQ